MKKVIVVFLLFIHIINLQAQSSPNLIEFSPNGDLISIVEDKEVKVFEYPEMREVYTHKFHPAIQFLEWSNSQDLLAVGTIADIIIIDLSSSQEFVFDVDPTSKYIPEVADISWNISNKLAISYSYPSQVTAVMNFNVTTLSPESFLEVSEIGRADNLDWSPNGDALFIDGVDGTGIFNAAASSTEIFIPNYHLTSVAWSPNGLEILGVGFDGLYVWDSQIGSELYSEPITVSSISAFYYTEGRWSPDGRQFAVALSSGGIQIFNSDTYQIEQVIPTEPNDRLSFAWNPNRHEIVYVDSSGIQIVEIMQSLPIPIPPTSTYTPVPPTQTPSNTPIPPTLTPIPPIHTPTNTPR